MEENLSLDDQRKVLKISKRVANFIDMIVVKGISQVEAYRENYATTNWTDADVRYEVKKLLKKPEIAEYMQNVLMTRKNMKNIDETFVIDMLKATAIAKKDTQIGVRALELLGKSLGMFKEVSVTENDKVISDADKLFELGEKAKQGQNIDAEIKKLDNNKGSGDEDIEFFDEEE